MPNVYVTAITRYGDARVSISKKQWEDALKGASNSKNHISIKVRESLNKQGAGLEWLRWDDITFGSPSRSAESPVPTSTILYSDIKKFGDGVAKLAKQPENPPQPQPSPLALHNARVADMAEQAEAMVTNEELDEATRLFPGFFGPTPSAPRFDACGCTPRPITAM